MKEHTTAKNCGIGLLCDYQGIILAVISDGLGITDAIRPGSPFHTLMEEQDQSKAEWFIHTFQNERVAHSTVFNLTAGGKTYPLHFPLAQLMSI